MSRIVALAALLAAAGCYKIDYVNGPKTGSEQTVWHHRVINGMVELPGPVKLNELCPSGISAIHTELSFPNWAVTYVLGNIVPSGALIYNPSTIKVWCASGAAYEGTYDEAAEAITDASLIPGAMSPDYEDQGALETQ